MTPTSVLSTEPRSAAHSLRCAQDGDNGVDGRGIAPRHLGSAGVQVPLVHCDDRLSTPPHTAAVDCYSGSDLRPGTLSTVSTAPTTTTYCPSSKKLNSQNNSQNRRMP